MLDKVRERERAANVIEEKGKKSKTRTLPIHENKLVYDAKIIKP